MELTKGQQRGLEIACERYNNNKPYTVISGFAGTGKTTLVRFIIDELGLWDKDVVYVAYTGKAVQVLKNKGNDNAMTTHKLLYRTTENPDGTFTHTPKQKLDHRYKMIVCDECSMLPQEMVDLILSHGVYTLFMGDGEQLPPIGGDQNLLEHPHIFLDEVVRQALDNPIIKLSMDVRNGKQLSYGGDKKCRVIPTYKVSDNLLLGADIIIVGKNITRHQINARVRKLRWGDNYQECPIEDDKCICLKNDWKTLGSDGNPLINGQMGTLHNIRVIEMYPYGNVLIADFISDDGDVYKDLKMDYQLITEGKQTINRDNWKKFAGYPKLYEFSFAYAVTCHKSQGSEYPRVLCMYEAFGDATERRKWAYTAITRASEQLVIAK